MPAPLLAATPLLAVFSVLLLAAATQAVTGFGFALVAVPLLTLVAGPRTAVVGASLVAPLLTSVTAYHDRREITWRPVGLVLAGSIVGMPAGLLALSLLPGRALTAVIAVVVLGSTVIVWRRPRLRGGPGMFAAVGLVCGALTTATGVNGPPLVAALQAAGYPPRPFRATLAAIFVASGVAGLVGFGLAGQLTGRAALVALVGVPAVLAGWYLGNVAFARVDRDRFRRIVLLTLVASSIVTLASAAR